ncbi:O-antigen ligase family protein [Saccharothrix xinjiangensis]|uniref:O-antigen ligase family protein n=1 Tax=Saccharothrix xinjiangensis TaxID=204798 RepID=A0ABV9YEJ1_9PSEU
MPVQHERVPAATAAPNPVLALPAAVAVAVVAQGGYHLPGRVLSGVLAGLALLLVLRTRPSAGPLSWACGALAAWALLRAGLDGQPPDALPTVAALGTVAAAAVVGRQANPAQRDLVASALVGLGATAALVGWAAVAFRVPSWSMVSEGLVRASTTVTYPNSAAALFAALALLALGLRTGKPGSPGLAAAAYALLVGLGATLSRAGLVAGLVVLGAVAGPRAVARHAAPAALGALVALGALAPSIPAAGPADPPLACLGLAAGLAVALGLSREGVRRVGVPVGFALVGAVAWAFRDRLAAVSGTRLTVDSPDREGALRSAFEQVAARPWTGAGPGRGWFTFTGPAGGTRAMRYAHNEYVQVLVELGLVGLVLLALVLAAAAAAVVVWRGRPGALWAGAAAGLVALLAHSGFDFLWHLPVTLLTAGLLIGLASAQTEESP